MDLHLEAGSPARLRVEGLSKALQRIRSDREPLELQPRWITFETRLRSGTGRTLLGALISLTPGTLTCDLQGETLLIHVLNETSESATVSRIRQQFESLLIRMEEA